MIFCSSVRAERVESIRVVIGSAGVPCAGTSPFLEVPSVLLASFPLGAVPFGEQPASRVSPDVARMAPSAMADLRVTGHDIIDPIDPPSPQA